jgi:vacuolar protein sorting-associated protein 11
MILFRIVQTLSSNPNACLGLASEHLSNVMRTLKDSISEDQQKVHQYEEETKKMREQIDELRTTPRIFQSRNCHACGSGLDMPSVHFFCNHSFHQRCLGDSDKVCPVCERANRKVFEMKKSLEIPGDLHEQFFRYLKGSSDGFKTVSDFFGRGVFTPH